jgi:hypothetical protein
VIITGRIVTDTVIYLLGNYTALIENLKPRRRKASLSKVPFTLTEVVVSDPSPALPVKKRHL